MNKLQSLKPRVVTAARRGPGDPVATAKGGVVVGPALAGIDFAGAGVGEETLVRSFLRQVVRAVLCPLGLASEALIFLDSLHGNGPTLDLLESPPGSPADLVGAQGLEELPECAWRETGPDPRRGLSHSAWARAWVQCEGWNRKRPMICHRFTLEGEFVPRYAGIIAFLNQSYKRAQNVMETWGLPVEETLWGLYGQKQGMETRWKEPLSDLGLHHPPCAQASVNAVFYAVGAPAYNLAVGVRELGLGAGEDRGMRLWRFRRAMIVVATVTFHAGGVVARLLDGRDHLVDRLLAAMHRLARRGRLVPSAAEPSPQPTFKEIFQLTRGTPGAPIRRHRGTTRPRDGCVTGSGIPRIASVGVHCPRREG